ncbi:MAG: cell filamentation protein Fic, partial [Planctomycetes bacterium]|nr:cell filamentation protein Fic [Planctomycetota bacterium]
MSDDKNNLYSRPLTVFHGRRLPKDARLLAGYGALVNNYQLAVPLPQVLSVISLHHRRDEEGPWRIFTPGHKPEESLAGQLTFALRYEGIDLLVLKRLFQKLPASELSQMIAEEPTSLYRRRIWFLYEWLMEQRLELDDAKQGNYADLVDDGLQYAGPEVKSKRHRIRNNLPGIRTFCPMIRRTAKLDAFIQAELRESVQKAVGAVHAEIMA